MEFDDALADLVATSGDRLLRVGYQLTHDRSAAQDLVQDALLHVYGSVRRRGDAPKDWYAYLRRAVVNEYLRSRRLRSSTEIVTELVPESPAAELLDDRIAERALLWQPWVPAAPVHVDGTARLVPARLPSSAVICAYAPAKADAQKSGPALAGRLTLTRGLGNLASLLTWEPRAATSQGVMCAQPVTRQVDYLIGLTYPRGGRLWVASVGGGCAETSNGEFSSLNQVGGTITQAFASGRWPKPDWAPVRCHADGGAAAGRLGQDKQMVPTGPTSLTICARGGRTYTAGFTDLVTALDAPPTFTSRNGCSEEPGPQHLIELYFSYRQGPPVNVSVFTSCTPAVDNTSLQATSSRAIWPIIQRLLGG